MTRVSISRKNAEAIFRYLNAETTAIWMPAFHELRAALQPRAKSSAVKKREKRNRTKGAETWECDRQKTLNIHGSDHWRAVFQSHANSYGFGVEARKALDRNESRALVKKAAAVMEASR